MPGEGERRHGLARPVPAEQQHRRPGPLDGHSVQGQSAAGQMEKVQMGVDQPPPIPHSSAFGQPRHGTGTVRAGLW